MEGWLGEWTGAGLSGFVRLPCCMLHCCPRGYGPWDPLLAAGNIAPLEWKFAEADTERQRNRRVDGCAIRHGSV